MADKNSAKFDWMQAGQTQPDPDMHILSDCNGTLFSPRIGEALNEKLFYFLVMAKNAGFKVTIFSQRPDDNERTLKLVCKRFLGPEHENFFGPIMDKSDYVGEKAFMVFDDDHGSHKVEAQFKADPLNDATLDKMNAWFTVLPEIDAHFQGRTPVPTP